MRRGLAVCEQCNSVCVAKIFVNNDESDGKKIVPMGVADCPDCGGDEFVEMDTGTDRDDEPGAD